MDRVNAAEQQRRLEQARLDGGKTTQERNRLGQFATPFPLALEIAQLAVEHLKNEHYTIDTIDFLDPGCGSGVFYSALLQTSIANQLGSAYGIEIDPAFAEVARSLWAPFGFQVIQDDFTRLTSFFKPDLPNLIICNPPYSRHHHLEQLQKNLLQTRASKTSGLWLNGLAGLYCYFLLLSHQWLRPGGLSIWLIPTEFMDVNYGEAIRIYLSQHVTLKRLHRFEASDVQFADALVSSAVVVFENRKPTIEHQAIFTVGSSLSQPSKTYTVKNEWLSKAHKWTHVPESISPSTQRTQPEISFGNLFKVRRGLATGANGYFILPRSKAEEQGLPAKFLKPILPSPRYLTDVVIEADGDGYPLRIPQLVLIDCDWPEEQVQAEYPSLWEYLEHGKRLGIHERYLTSKRNPWYKQEQVPASPFLCTYMGRAQENKSPLRFIWNQSKATSPNVYHVIYPREHLTAYMGNSLELQAEIFRLLSRIDNQIIISEGRTYGGGLHKIEPHELYRISLSNIAEAQKLVASTMLF
ncbi:MAG TPA: class I SAM-dependent methyltransferase [Aggregatilineaceae bacterium]|nr:class I SAM-dependent methyltransferase [Aggregatilineaceae bacterium]